METWPQGTYDVIYADPPWDHYGSPNKWAAAGKHYELLDDSTVAALPVADSLSARGVVYLWATCPRLDVAVDTVRAWGLHYRGVAFVWVKTTQAGVPIKAQGVRPSIVKPLVEVVIAASRVRRGRPLPIADEGVCQTVFAPRGRHSSKPLEVRESIVRLHPDASRLELFARTEAPGWVSWGDELPA